MTYTGTLASWTRMLQGKLSDKLLGRHLLIGVVAGSVVALGKMVMIHFPIVDGMLPSDSPKVLNLIPLVGGRS